MSFQSMFICCNMYAASTVRVVDSLSSSSSISLKIYLHFMIQHFNSTHVSHCHRKVDNVWLHQARSRPIFVTPRGNKLILSWSHTRPFTVHCRTTATRQNDTNQISLIGENSFWVEGSLTYSSYPGRANFSFTSLQNLAKCLLENKMLARLEGVTALLSRVNSVKLGETIRSCVNIVVR